MVELKDVIELMKCFPESFMNHHGEVILNRKTNTFINVERIETKEEMICNILKYCTRDMAKGMFCHNQKLNILMRNEMIQNLNAYLKTNFSSSDIAIMYNALGNGINRKLTLEFVRSGYDMKVLANDKE